MLCAQRKSDGRQVLAHSESKQNGPFKCQICREEVILRHGTKRLPHFAHVNPIACKFATGESEEHRRCKFEIFRALLRAPEVKNVMLERPLGGVRPDIFAEIHGVPVAIEVQLSNLSQETIIYRTSEYARKGIYVLWLPLWTPYLETERYSPRLWEQWVHAAYFGRVYYWMKGLTVVSYAFNPCILQVPRNSWVTQDGKQITAGGFTRKSKRYRAPKQVAVLDLLKDFAPKQREGWTGGKITVPFAKLYTAYHEH